METSTNSQTKSERVKDTHELIISFCICGQMSFFLLCVCERERERERGKGGGGGRVFGHRGVTCQLALQDKAAVVSF